MGLHWTSGWATHHSVLCYWSSFLYISLGIIIYYLILHFIFLVLQSSLYKSCILVIWFHFFKISGSYIYVALILYPFLLLFFRSIFLSYLSFCLYQPVFVYFYIPLFSVFFAVFLSISNHFNTLLSRVYKCTNSSNSVKMRSSPTYNGVCNWVKPFWNTLYLWLSWLFWLLRWHLSWQVKNGATELWAFIDAW